MIVGNGKHVIGSSEFYYNEDIIECEVASFVKRIENWAFGYCVNMETVYIPASVEYINGNAFDGCSRLKWIEVDPANRHYCSQEGVLYNSRMIHIVKCPCAYEKEVFELPPSVIEIAKGAFNRCANIRHIVIGKKVRIIGEKAFAYCGKLEEIIIPETIERIEESAFADCYSLKRFCISDKSPKYEVFNKCLTIKGEFPELIQFPLGDTAETYQVDKRIRIINDRAFTGASQLNWIEVEKENEQYKSIEGVLLEVKRQRIICYPTKKEDISSYIIPEEVNIVGNSSFKLNRHLKEVIFPKQLKLIERHSFEYCHELQEITFTGQNLQKIEWCAFMGCNKLKEINLAEQKQLGVIESLAFAECENLEVVKLPLGDICQLGISVFRKCANAKIHYQYKGE